MLENLGASYTATSEVFCGNHSVEERLEQGLASFDISIADLDLNAADISADTVQLTIE